MSKGDTFKPEPSRGHSIRGVKFTRNISSKVSVVASLDLANTV